MSLERSFEMRLQSIAEYKVNGNNKGICEIRVRYLLADSGLICWQKPIKISYEPKSFDPNPWMTYHKLSSWSKIVLFLLTRTRMDWNEESILIKDGQPLGVLT